MENLDLLIEKFKEVKEELEKGVVKPVGSTIIAEDQARAASMGAPTNSAIPAIRPKIKASMDRAIASYAGKQPTLSSMKKDDFDDKTAASPPKLNAHGKAVASAPQESQAGQTVNFGAGVGLPNHKLGRGSPNQVHNPHVTPWTQHGMATPAGYGQGSSDYSVTTSIPKLKPAATNKVSVGAAHSFGSPPVPADPTVNLRKPMLGKAEASPKFEKTINSSYVPDSNMAMSADEKLTLNKSGQWNLEKAEGDLCSKCKINKVTSTTGTSVCNSCRVATAQDKMKARGTPVEKPAAHPPVKKDEDGC